eukprot:TRINITY_DN40456_c0_g1_i1.p1 TRINITY_DN40456_c0_g1~~TRINITY_DN40456_c0_g1_i1.p1  ORF type:complete len:523 (+),score=86.98 TRINITY_DN40456_c0_g1_i1:123-1691(+)
MIGGHACSGVWGNDTDPGAIDVGSLNNGGVLPRRRGSSVSAVVGNGAAGDGALVRCSRNFSKRSHIFRMLFPCYVDEAGAKRLSSYVFRGSDNSLAYKYFLSPLAATLVDRFVPLWLSPNAITTIGFVPSMGGHALVWLYCADLKSECPPWCWAVLACCTFLYQTIDNMDGKQARRIGLSTPLGLLVDHGIDALNITLSSLNIMALFRLGNSWKLCMTVWLAGAVPFFFATWEEYYTGTLCLGVINGPSDGVLLVCITFIISSFVDDYTAFWEAPLLEAAPVSRKMGAICFFVISVFATVTTNFVSVLRVHQSCLHGPSSPQNDAKVDTTASRLIAPDEAAEAATKRPRFMDAAILTLPFSLGCGGAAAWLALSASDIFSQQPRLVFLLFGIIFAKQVLHLQFAHVVGTQYHALTKSFVFVFIAIISNALISRCYGGGVGHVGTAVLVDEVVLLQVCMLFAFSAWAVSVGRIGKEVSTALGISIFSTSPLVRGDLKACVDGCSNRGDGAVATTVVPGRAGGL